MLGPIFRDLAWNAFRIGVGALVVLVAFHFGGPVVAIATIVVAAFVSVIYHALRLRRKSD
jgi:hypothetical protein